MAQAKPPEARDALALILLSSVLLALPPTLGTVRMNRLTFEEGAVLLCGLLLSTSTLAAGAWVVAAIAARLLALPTRLTFLCWSWGALSPPVAYGALMLYRRWLRIAPLDMVEPQRSLREARWVFSVELTLLVATGVAILAASALLLRRLWERSGPSFGRLAAGASGALLLAALAVLTVTHFGWRPQQVTPQKSVVEPGADGVRVLIVGVDGADWQVLDLLRSQGELPNLAALIERGVSARLETLVPTYSSNIWTSYYTGVPPERHNIRDFVTYRLPGFDRDIYMPTGWTAGLLTLERLGVLYRSPISSRYRTARPLWDVAGAAGLSTLHVGTFATWPVDRIRGVMITDRLAETVRAYRVHRDRERFSRELRSIASDPERLLSLLDGRISDRSEFDPQDLHAELFLELFPEVAPQLGILYLEQVDRVSHRLFCCDASCLPRRAECHEPLLSVYRRVDAILGRLLALTRPEDVVIVVSDHGFGLFRRSFEFLRSHHGNDGVFAMAGGPVAPGSGAPMTVLDLMPTVLYLLGLPRAADTPGRVRLDYLRPDFVTAHPVREVASYETKTYPLVPPPQTEQEQQALLEELRMLGYIE